MRNRTLACAAVSAVVALSAVAIPTTARAQDTSSAASAAPAPSAPKKVWTNDDVSDLRGESVISTVGGSSTGPSGKPAPPAKNPDARNYQAQIARLEAQIPPIDSQIAELQAAIDGKPTGDAKSSQRPRGVKADSWTVEMQDLQKKRDGIETQIATLKDQARHHGVAPNTLP
jgi:peptidoglycan hydrolase CwlO-like protein